MQIYLKSIPYSMKLLTDSIKSGRVLDVGGAELPARANTISNTVEEVILLDVQKPIHPINENVTFLQAAVETLNPEKHGLFDHVILSNVLEHLDKPLTGFMAAASVLNNGGSVHILSPNCDSLNRRIGFLMGKLPAMRYIPEKEIAMGHKHALNVEDIISMIKTANLQLQECRGVFLKPVPTPEMIAWSEDRIKAFFDVATDIPPELCHEVYFKALKT